MDELMVWKSNCFMESFKAKLKGGKNVVMLWIDRKHNKIISYFPHFLWYDRRTNLVYDFYRTEQLKHIWNVIRWQGHLREIPMEKFERKCKEVLQDDQNLKRIEKCRAR